MVTTMENQMEKKMENEMETGIIEGISGPSSCRPRVGQWTV